MTNVLIYCNVDKMQLKPSDHATVGLGFSENIIIIYRDLEISAECSASMLMKIRGTKIFCEY